MKKQSSFEFATRVAGAGGFSFGAPAAAAATRAVDLPPKEWAFDSRPKFRAQARNSWKPSTSLDLGQQKMLMVLIGQLTRVSLIDNIDFPRVVVLGAENCGKSSTLEMVTNIPFPSSNGLTTTCPIVVERNVTTDAPSTKISLRMGSAIFPVNGEEVDESQLETKMQLYMNLAEVVEFMSRNRRSSREIEAALVAVHAQCQHASTDRSSVFHALSVHLGRDVTASEALISNSTYVHLAVEQPAVEPVTYIDLPGYKANRTQVQDDIIKHNARIVQQNQETLILHVLRCTDFNLGNIPSQNPVHELDPTGERSINVLTSFDLMFDQEKHYTNNFTQEAQVQGSFPIWISELQLEQAEMATGKRGRAAFSTQRGFVAVRNRTTQERDRGVSIPDVKATLSATGGVYDDWCTQLPDLLRREENVGADCLEAQVIRILSSRMSFVLPSIVGHLLRTLAHIECKWQLLSDLHGNTEGSTRDWTTIVNEFRSKIMRSLGSWISSRLKVWLDQNIPTMEPSVLQHLVDPERLASHLIKEYDDEVGDVRCQEEYLCELWTKVQEMLTQHLASMLQQLQPKLVSLLSAMTLGDVAPDHTPACRRAVLNPAVTDRVLTPEHVDTSGAHQAAFKESVSQSVTPVTVLVPVAEADLREVLQAIDSGAVSDLLEQTFEEEISDFYRKPWYLQGRAKARNVHRQVGAKDNAYDLAYAVKELYDQSISGLRAKFVEQLVNDVKGRIDEQFGDGAVQRWLHAHLSAMELHGGWHEARNFLAEKRALYTAALHACVSYYTDGVDYPYVLQ